VNFCGAMDVERKTLFLGYGLAHLIWFIAVAEVCILVSWCMLSNFTKESILLYGVFPFLLCTPVFTILSVICQNVTLAIVSICIHAISAILQVGFLIFLADFEILKYYFEPSNLFRFTVVAFPLAFFWGIVLFILIEFARILRQGGTGYEAITIGHQEVNVEAPLVP